MPMLDRKASCSDMPMRFSVERPRREMSMRRVGIETPRSYASVATSANSCAAKRDPRRVARKATWRRRRISSVSDERSMSSPAPPAEDGVAPAASARRRNPAVIFIKSRRLSR